MTVLTVFIIVVRLEKQPPSPLLHKHTQFLGTLMFQLLWLFLYNMIDFYCMLLWLGSRLFWEDVLRDNLLNFASTAKGILLLQQTGTMNECVSYMYQRYEKKLQVNDRSCFVRDMKVSGSWFVHKIVLGSCFIHDLIVLGSCFLHESGYLQHCTV